ncbi:hypothetical protein CI088_10285 [Enterococcus plantarum]|uniref:Uncharacterized protein n=2 Tax=Enterococcus plantarum TaxID=1077675 RepID=A0A2W3YY60_9ENTE|nr:hypothetical protein CI088_10285 [Enterococcus plantarum]
MNFINSYVKKIVKKTIFLSTTLVVFMTVGLVFIFIVKGFKMPHATVEDIVIVLILGFSLPIIILGIVIGLPLLKINYQINKYLTESQKLEQEELYTLLKRECSDKEAKWHLQARYSNQFMVLLPDVIIKRDDLSSCKRFGTKQYRNGTYYRVKFKLKSGKEKVIDCSSTLSVDATIRWWEQK